MRNKHRHGPEALNVKNHAGEAVQRGSGSRCGCRWAARTAAAQRRC